jgi:hypothetical protein
VTGVVAGSVSAGLRWLMFRHEAERRSQRMRAEMMAAADKFASVVDQAQQKFEGLVGLPKPQPPKVDAVEGGIRVSGPFVVGPASSPEDLDKMLGDLFKARRESDGR